MAHAGMRLGRRDIQMRDPAAGDRGRQTDRVKQVSGVVVGGEGRGAGYLGKTVAPRQRLAGIRSSSCKINPVVGRIEEN
jgi:hypothetical protein